MATGVNSEEDTVEQAGAATGAGSDSKMDRLIAAAADCRYVIAMHIGEIPRRSLDQKGIRAIMTYDRIEKAVLEAEQLYADQ